HSPPASAQSMPLRYGQSPPFFQERSLSSFSDNSARSPHPRQNPPSSQSQNFHSIFRFRACRISAPRFLFASGNRPTPETAGGLPDIHPCSAGRNPKSAAQPGKVLPPAEWSKFQPASLFHFYLRS